MINDADAAGLAEVRFGAGIRRPGVVVMVTLGTGIGTTMFIDSVLVSSTEYAPLISGRPMSTGSVTGGPAWYRQSSPQREGSRKTWIERLELGDSATMGRSRRRSPRTHEMW